MAERAFNIRELASDLARAMDGNGGNGGGGSSSSSSTSSSSKSAVKIANTLRTALGQVTEEAFALAERERKR
jgi:hypothetical protein